MPGSIARLTVFFDGQFWVAFCEREDEEGLVVARYIFGPEPSLPEIFEFVSGRSWLELDFLPTSHGGELQAMGSPNPKRAQREAARQMRSDKARTRAQEAMRLALEERALEAKTLRREQREAEAAQRREQEVAKRKAKKRGH